MFTPDQALGAAEKTTDFLMRTGLLGAVVIEALIIAFLVWVNFKIRTDQMKDYGVFGEKLIASEKEHAKTALGIVEVAKGLILLTSPPGLREGLKNANRNARKRQGGGGSGDPEGAPCCGTGTEGDSD